MIAALLVYATFLLSADQHAPIPIDAIFRTAGRVLVEVTTKVDGQVRGLLVREGMTEETVSRILGRECVIFLGGEVDSKPVIFFHYIKSGVDIYYRYDEKGDVFRVDRVTLPSLSLRSLVPAQR